MDVEEAEAQPLQFVIDPVAQVGDDLPLCQAGGGHVVMVGEHRAQEGLGDNRQRHHGDGLHRGPRGRGRPAKRIQRRPLCRVEGVADDVDDRSEQLEPGEAEQQQRHAQDQRPQAIAAELPRQGEQPPHEFTGGIPALVVLAGRRIGHNQSDKMPPARRAIQRKAVKVAQASRLKFRNFLIDSDLLLC